jgi:hypothetical protein
LLNNLQRINQQQSLPMQTQNQQAPNLTIIQIEKILELLRMPVQTPPVTNQISAKSINHNEQLQSQPSSQSEEQPSTHKTHFPNDYQQLEDKKLPLSVQYNTSSNLINVNNQSQQGKIESSFVLRTTHLCLHISITKCFALMTKMKEVLRISNKTFEWKSKPKKLHGETKDQLSSQNVTELYRKTVLLNNLKSSDMPKIVNSLVQVNKNPASHITNSQVIANNNKNLTKNSSINTAEIKQVELNTNSIINNVPFISTFNAVAHKSKRKRETEDKEEHPRTLNGEKLAPFFSINGVERGSPNSEDDVQITDIKAEDIEFPVDASEVTSTNEKDLKNTRAEAFSDVKRTEINSPPNAIRKNGVKKNINTPFGGIQMPHRKAKVKGLSRLKSNHNENDSKQMIAQSNLDDEVDSPNVQEEKFQGHIQAPQLGPRKTPGKKRHRINKIEKPKPFKELIHDYEEEAKDVAKSDSNAETNIHSKAGESKESSKTYDSLNSDSKSKVEPKRDSEARDASKTNSETEDAPRADSKSENATSKSGASSKNTKSKSDVVKKAPDVSSGLKTESKSPLPKSDKVENKQKNKVAGSSKYPVLAFSDHPLYRILFKREAKFDQGK